VPGTVSLPFEEVEDLQKAKGEADLQDQGQLNGIPISYERVAALEMLLASEQSVLEINRAQLAVAEALCTNAECQH
jgi:hypothetical protein